MSAQMSGDHSAGNSPHGTDGGTSTKVNDGFYLFDAKLGSVQQSKNQVPIQ